MADFEEPARDYGRTPGLPSDLKTTDADSEDRGDYRRDRSASPRGDRDEPARSRSPNGRARPYALSLVSNSHHLTKLDLHLLVTLA